MKARFRCRSSANGKRRAYTWSGFFDNDKKLSKFTRDEMELLLHGKNRKFKTKFGERTQKAVMPYLKPRERPSCKGARLSPGALASKIDGHNIPSSTAGTP